jgi:REP-associated tyrosine transposase
MPRCRRLEVAGALHHITAKSPSGRLLFPDDRAKQLYLQLVTREVHEREWRILTFCLLSNHLHVLVLTPRTNLGEGFKRLHEDFARYLNRTLDVNGPAFAQRFHNKLVRDDSHAIGCLRYIARNPVAAGIVSNAAQWPWSAHRALAGFDAPPELLSVDTALGFFDEDLDNARRQYRSLVATDDQALLASLERPDTDRWLIDAVDDHAIDIAEIATFLKLSTSRAYRRLSAARATAGTVPGVARH